MNRTFREKSDVLIIGGGLTGHIAALELIKKKYSVTMLCCGFGASPGVSGFNVPCAEKEDSVETFIQDTLVSGRNQCDPKLVDALCYGSAKIQSYLESIGFEFDHNPDGSLKARKSLGSSYGRVVGHGNGSGAQILKVVREKLENEEEFVLQEQVRALRLLKNDKQVYGAIAYDLNNKQFVRYYAKAVLLCNGGFAGIYPFTSNSKDIGGDGAAMALQAGCSLVDMEFVQFEPSSAVWPLAIRGKGMITTLFYEGAIMTNGKGERFMLKYGPQAECVNKDVLSHCIEKEIMAGNASTHGGVYFDASGVDEARLHDAYQPFIDRYAAVGIDLTKEPVELANAAHTSLGGVKIDDHCRSELKGLYVGGEAAGHLHGANRIGGSAGAETIVFGRIAAETISEEIVNLGEYNDVDESTQMCRMDCSASAVEALSHDVKDILGNCAGVYRSADKLEEGIAALQDIYEKVSQLCSDNNEDSYRIMRLQNDCLTALAWTKAALNRKDSCGAHQRLDYPDAPAMSYHTEIKLCNNQMIVSNIEN